MHRIVKGILSAGPYIDDHQEAANGQEGIGIAEKSVGSLFERPGKLRNS
jgi:hypothetical protein